MYVKLSTLVILLISGFCSVSLSQELTVSGLRKSVAVRRDARDIPYISATNEHDLYFAQGYTVAGDRLFQMDLMRRLARGETAEIFGQLTLEEDKRWRRFGFSSVAENSLTHLSPNLRAALDAYCDGVNARIAEFDANTFPVEFRILQYKPHPWTGADTIVIGKLLADALSTTWRNDIARMQSMSLSPEKIDDVTNLVTPFDVVLFGKDLPSKKTGTATHSIKAGDTLIEAADRDVQLRVTSLERVGLYAEELAASNNWVISGKLTADGKPILANDPHLAATAPGIWYLVELQTPDLHAAGVALPGVPGVVLGHNDSIAWGATNVGPDVQDLYEEKVSAIDPGGIYCFVGPTGCERPDVREELIFVRKSPLESITTRTTVPLRVEVSRHGPVILEDAGKKYSLQWTALDPKNLEFEAFFRLNRAKDWNDFTNALKTYGGATQNFVFADTKGNIGWYAAGKIPTRRSGDGSVPYDGATTHGDWTGYIPFEELPHLYNPPSGLIVTANQRIAGTNYKYPQIGRDVAPPWRARRIMDMLTAKKGLTIDDVRDAQMSAYNIPLASFSKEIVKRSAASVETLAVLKDWTGEMQPDSRGALLADGIRNCVANKMANANRPAPAYAVRERVLEPALRLNWTRWLPSEFPTYDALIKGCDGETRSSFAADKRFGTDPIQWTWGKNFVSRFMHPLASVPLIGGQFATPNIGISGSGQTPNVGSSVSMRLIASPGNWDATRHVIPLGESGDPASPHFKDQFDLWRSGVPAIFPFSEAAKAKATVRSLTLNPK